MTAAEIEAFARYKSLKVTCRVGQFWDLARQTQEGFEAYARQTVSLFDLDLQYWNNFWICCSLSPEQMVISPTRMGLSATSGSYFWL